VQIPVTKTSPIHVKGREKPQQVYELIKSSEVETRFDASISKGLTRFVGRENSMTAINSAWDKAISGSGQVLGIVGEAGVGKSRLLLEFRNSLSLDEFTFIEGRCLHFGDSMSYLPFLDIIRTYFGIKEGENEDIISDKIDAMLKAFDNKLVPNSLLVFQDISYFLFPRKKTISDFPAIFIASCFI
jgi:hypothetical protein